MNAGAFDAVQKCPRTTCYHDFFVWPNDFNYSTNIASC